MVKQPARCKDCGKQLSTVTTNNPASGAIICKHCYGEKHYEPVRCWRRQVPEIELPWRMRHYLN